MTRPYARLGELASQWETQAAELHEQIADYRPDTVPDFDSSRAAMVCVRRDTLDECATALRTALRILDDDTGGGQ